jgi:YVTN family beta-propeller protein
MTVSAPPPSVSSSLNRIHPALLIILGVLLFLAMVGALVGGCAVAFVHSLSNLNITIGPFPAPSSYGMNAVVSANGSVAYVSEPTLDRLAVLDTRTGMVTASVPVGATPSGLAISPNGQQVWVVDTNVPAASTSASVSVVSTATNSLVQTIGVGAGAIDVAFSPDDNTAYVTNNGVTQSGSVDVIDTSIYQVVGSLLPKLGSSGSWYPTSVVVSPDGRYIWVSSASTVAPPTSGSPPDRVYVFDSATGAEVASISVGQGPYFMVLSGDGRYAYVADKVSCDMKEIATSTFQVVATVDAPSGDGCPFGVAPGAADGVAYAVTGQDHTVRPGTQGNALEIFDFRTSALTTHKSVGVDPVTVSTSPLNNLVYVVDANRPKLYGIDPATGAVKTTWHLSPTLRPSSPTSS